MVMVSSHLQRSFETSAPRSEVMALLGTIEFSAQHMPNVEKVEPGPEENSFTWTLEKLGAGPISMQVWYCSVYDVNEDAGTVVWKPVEGQGNAYARGRWSVTERDGKTFVELDSEFGAQMPVPRMMKGAAEKVLDREYNRVLDNYTGNLKKTLDGGNGRLR